MRHYAWRHDAIFRMIAEYDGVVKEIIETTTGLDIEVAEIKAQYAYENKPGHSIILDARCVEKNGTIWDVEIQNSNDPSILKRLRFYGDLITVRSFNEGDSYANVPNVGVVCIMDFDPLALGWPLYKCKIALDPETPQEREQLAQHAADVAKRLEMGIRYYLVNATARNDSKIARLIEELAAKDALYPEAFPAITAMKHDMLETKKGRDKMNVALTDYEKKAYDNGYDSGYGSGYDSGYDSGYGSGYDNGRDSVYALQRALKDRLLAEDKVNEYLQATTDPEYCRELAKFYFPNGLADSADADAQ